MRRLLSSSFTNSEIDLSIHRFQATRSILIFLHTQPSSRFMYIQELNNLYIRPCECHVFIQYLVISKVALNNSKILKSTNLLITFILIDNVMFANNLL